VSKNLLSKDGSVGFEDRHCSLLIRLHQAGVPSYVCSKDGGKLMRLVHL
jgi:hypothetical protein